MDKIFKLKENKTTVKTEIIAGVTTFLAMAYILAVNPGITCYWEFCGRIDVRFEAWLKLDLKYVEEQSFWTDMEILWKTVGVVLNGKGAY